MARRSQRHRAQSFTGTATTSAPMLIAKQPGQALIKICFEDSDEVYRPGTRQIQKFRAVKASPGPSSGPRSS